METLISVIWFICGIIMAIKWSAKEEQKIIRMGSAKTRMESTFWDWCFRLFLSLVVLSVPFYILKKIFIIFGFVFKIIIIIILVGAIILGIYSLLTKNSEGQEVKGEEKKQDNDSKE